MSLPETPYWSQPTPLAELISDTLDWYTRNPNRAGPILNAIEHDLPRGSGIDSGTTIDRDNEDITNPESSFILASSWHAMDSNGYYAGWFAFNVIVTSSFSGPLVEIEWVDENPERDYPVELVDCPECNGTGECEEEEGTVEECPECSGTGQVEDGDAEWVGISDPTDYLVDVYRESLKELHARIEYDNPPENVS